MGTFGTFLLAFFAFIGTMMIINDPSVKLMNWSRGKSRSVIEAESKAWVEKNGVSRMIALGCGYVFYLIVAILYTFVVEPVAIVGAILNQVGNQPLAYVMLAIAGYAWIRSALGFKKMDLQGGQKKTVVTTEDGDEIEGVVINETINIPDANSVMLRRLFFALPTFYLWYLFAIQIGILN